MEKEKNKNLQGAEVVLLSTKVSGGCDLSFGYSNDYGSYFVTYDGGDEECLTKADLLSIKQVIDKVISIIETEN